MPPLPYLLPAGVFLAITFLWFVGQKVPRLFATLPTLSCYAVTVFMVLWGGSCHRVAHIKLTGLELDLVDHSGKPRAISLGGAPAGKSPAEGIEIPGLPNDALELEFKGENLFVKPGSGYQRGILVRSDGRLVPLEEGGVPRLVPLQAGDQIDMPPNEGGLELYRWRLGPSYGELQVDAKLRWIGADGNGLAKLSSMPAQMLGLAVEGKDIVIKAGPGWKPELGVLINGLRKPLAPKGELKVSYLPGLTTLALVLQDTLAGQLTYNESSPPLRTSASLTWQSSLSAPQASSFEIETGRSLRVGGALEDDVFVKGLPPSGLLLHVDAAGQMTLEPTEDGRKALARRLLVGTYPQTVSLGQALVLGDATVPYVGTFHLLGEAAVAPVSSATANEASEAESIISPVTGTTVPPAKVWRCAWQPNRSTQWTLPNRSISLPLADVPVELFTRRLWTQRVFPLSMLSARESSYRSCVVYPPDHPSALVNGASLLQFEPRISLTRSGKALPAQTTDIGLLKKKAKLEILQVIADAQGEKEAHSASTALHPTQVYEGQRITVRRRFAQVDVILHEHERKKIPVLKIVFEKPQVRSVSMTDVKEGLAAREDEGLKGTRFGINDRRGFSELPHQVTFPMLTRSFDEANADVTMDWFSFTVQDDFKKQVDLSYGSDFEIGGANRMQLRLTKETVPYWRTFFIIIAGLIAIVVSWIYASNYWWMALQFGVSFLTCNRVLFGQAVAVNPPFNSEVIELAMPALVLAPILLGALRYFAFELLQGQIETKLQWIEQRLSYRWIAATALALLFMRVGLLLGMGAKEAISIAGVRIALSVFFVPAYLALFAQACYRLWLEKETNDGLQPATIIRFAIATLWLFTCQAITALLTSDLGMFLYFIPMALVLAIVGLCALWDGLVRTLRQSAEERKQQRRWLASLAGLALTLPLLSMILVFTAPKAVIGAWPGLRDEMSSSEELVTDSTLLRVLQFADEDYLINLGTDTAERIAQDHAIMANYAHRGLNGVGYLQVDVLAAKATTALNDNVSAIYIFAQFGVLGALAILIAYLAVMISSLGARDRINSLTSWLALLAGMSFALVSLYMMGANYGLLPFTGRNMYLLGLNSMGDLIESAILIACIIIGMARTEYRNQQANQSSLTDIIQGNAE